jgi:hypothetical protein
MLFMILQLGSLGDIIVGITTAATGRISDEAERKEGKCNFWYQ